MLKNDLRSSMEGRNFAATFVVNNILIFLNNDGLES